MEDAVAEWHAEGSRNGLRALLCGVTPEIASMAWPNDTELLAIDQSEAMMRLVWPGDIAGWRRVERGDWLRLPQPDEWFDLIVGDGCFSCMDYPDGYRALAASLHRVLKKQGLLLMRFFVRPNEREKPQAVFTDLLANRIGSFSAFRWRLTMALQEDPRDGVRAGDVWQALRDAGIDWDALVARTRWPAEAMHAIVNDDSRFSFPALGEVLMTLSDHFAATAVHVAQYELAERCPTVIFRPREAIIPDRAKLPDA
jgi:SAM-dependent methyltransferase